MMGIAVSESRCGRLVRIAVLDLMMFCISASTSQSLEGKEMTSDGYFHFVAEKVEEALCGLVVLNLPSYLEVG